MSRYYIVNCITGAHGLFVCKQTVQLNRQHFFTKSSYSPRFQRAHLQAYVNWYFDFAFQTVGMPVMNKNFTMTPFQTLDVMATFWYKTAVAQDTIAVCLEVQ